MRNDKLFLIAGPINGGLLAGAIWFLLNNAWKVGNAGATFADVATELGLAETATRIAASHMRQRYRELLRAEISQTLSSPDEVEDEICNLFAAFEAK